MPTTAIHAYVGPLVASGVTPIPFDFQAISSGEVGVVKDGVDIGNIGFTVALDGDGTGEITPLTNWGTSEIYIYSRPSYQNQSDFPRFEQFYPDQLNPPFDRIYREVIAVKSRLDLHDVSVTTLAPGSPGAATVVQWPWGLDFHFDIPRGDKGDIGLTGAKGDKGDTGAPGAAGVGVGGIGISNGVKGRVELLNVGLPAEEYKIDSLDQAYGALTDPLVIVIAGQSNALGANSGGANPSNTNVYTWDAITGAFVSGGQYNALPWTRAAPDGNGGNNNFALAAAHRLQKVTQRKVYVILDATSGTSIDAWVSAGIASTRYAALRTKVAAALATLPGKTVIDLMIWAQGEEDFVDSYATHLTNLTTLDTQLRAETWVDDYTPIFVTGMSDLHDRYEVAPVLENFANRIKPGWRFISTKGLPTSDATHFTGPALYEGGFNRIAQAFLGGRRNGEDFSQLPFYNRGAGKLVPSDQTAIATFSSLVNWDSRTDGPGVTDNYTGDGATTAFTLTSKGTISQVTVNGVVKVSPTDYTVTGMVITFAVAPPNTQPVVVTYAAAINSVAAQASISWGFRCAADGNFTFAGGYLCTTDNLSNYSIVYGRENNTDANGDYSAVFGFQNSGQSTYQLISGRGHAPGNLSGAVAMGLFSKFTDASRLFQFGIGTATSNRKNALALRTDGSLEILAVSTAADPAENEQITFKRITNTTFRMTTRGADGTVRYVDLPVGAAGVTLGGILSNPITFNNAGGGAASGSTADGSAAVTISWNTLGALPQTPRLQAAGSNSITPTFSNDLVQRLAANGAITLNNPTGTAIEGHGMIIRLRDDGTARAISYGTQYRAVGVAMPTTTVSGKLTVIGIQFNNTDTKWDVVSVAQET